MDKDSSKYSVIARCLQYASGSLPQDQEGKLILINEVENELEESLMEGEELKNTNCIAEDVRTKSPAAYLYADKSQRRVFFASTDNILKCYACDESGKKWSEFDLGPAAGLELHPEGGLCACFTPEGFRVYFQDSSGSLKGIAMQNDTLSVLDVVKADAVIGTPLAVSCSLTEPTISLYYMNLDGSLHCMTSDLSNGEWKDTVFPGSHFTDTVEKFITFRGEKDVEFEAFFLSTDKVFQVDSAGKKVELGSIVRESGDFIPSKTEQCYSPCYSPLAYYGGYSSYSYAPTTYNSYNTSYSYAPTTYNSYNTSYSNNYNIQSNYYQNNYYQNNTYNTYNNYNINLGSHYHYHHHSHHHRHSYGW